MVLLSVAFRNLNGKTISVKKNVEMILKILSVAALTYVAITLLSVAMTYIHGDVLTLPRIVQEIINGVMYGNAYYIGMRALRKSLNISNPKRALMFCSDVWVTILALDLLVISMLEGRFTMPTIFILPIIAIPLIPLSSTTTSWS